MLFGALLLLLRHRYSQRRHHLKRFFSHADAPRGGCLVSRVLYHFQAGVYRGLIAPVQVESSRDVRWEIVRGRRGVHNRGNFEAFLSEIEDVSR